MLEWLTQWAQPDLNWNYALITLVFRFFAVFVVLFMIQFGMYASSKLINRRSDDEDDTGGAEDVTTREPTGHTAGPDDLTVAAIGIALELESHPEASRVADDRSTSTWAVAGRVTSQRR